MSTIVKIGDCIVGSGHPCYIVAEAGCNHNQQLDMALALVDMAADCGADAVKFQSYHAENMYSRQTPMMEHFRTRLKAGPNATMYDLIKMTELPWEYHTPIAGHCRKRSIPFLSTPFEEEAVDLLESLDVPAYKIAAFEMTHYPLIQRVASTGKPIILSTGMSSLGDIEMALAAAQKENNDQIILLHCVSNYPARHEDYNLRVMNTLRQAFGHPVGLSDHTPGVRLAEIGIALGADLIEKHITLDQKLHGPDHYFSLTSEQLSLLVKIKSEVEAMLGSPVKRCTEAEKPMKKIGQRSLMAARDISKGEVITEDMLAIKRPGTGIHPLFQDTLIGMTASADIKTDTPLTWNMFIQTK